MSGSPRAGRTQGRYRVSVRGGFSAVHRLQLADGSVEPAHGHDWRVRATFENIELDSCGMVVDFHKAEGALAKVLASLHFGNLNEAPVFSGRNPTAEAVARHVFDELAACGMPVCRVEVTEAPECIAVYETVRG